MSPTEMPASRGWSIRTRLTLWYTAALGVLLLIMGSATYAVLKRVTRADSDAYLTDTADAVAASLQLALAGVPPAFAQDSLAPRWAADRTLENHRFRDIGVAIFQARTSNADGPVLHLLAVDTTSSATRYFGGAAGWQIASTSAVRALALMDTDLVTLDPHRERVVSLPVSTRRGLYVVAVSQSLAARDVLFARVRETMWIGVPIALLLAMAGGLGLAAASLRPVDAMRAQAEQITASNLHERLPVPSTEDELSRLSRTFNALLDRVEDAFEQRRRFTADASHELRTPVAIVIGESELALSSDRSADQYRSALRIIHGEARRLASIVGDLFLLARRDGAEQAIAPVPLFLEELVGDCVDAIGGIARSKGLTLEFSPMSEVPYTGDDAMLRRVVMNLLDNAIKYTPAGGRVRVEAQPRPHEGAVVRVSDTGVGIPAEHQPRIFERFYRVQHTTDRSGLADASGAGLGLPIAAWIAQAHGGSLQLVRSDDSGSVFELTLPGRLA
ncbi:MAG TPA: HAMP domain-containing protein [Gemmatimonas aurantiaca]|nr:ATP-binding protein [Gemmatimonas aurantiaca]HCT57811.1 HAMP domain-containing protein [Gemmatimonas aurantiaca]